MLSFVLAFFQIQKLRQYLKALVMCFRNENLCTKCTLNQHLCAYKYQLTFNLFMYESLYGKQQIDILTKSRKLCTFFCQRQFENTSVYNRQVIKISSAFYWCLSFLQIKENYRKTFQMMEKPLFNGVNLGLFCGITSFVAY